MAHIFLTPDKIISGINALKDGQTEILNFGYHALIVTDRTMINLGNVKKVTDILDQNRQKYTIFSQINSEPTDVMIQEGIKTYNENNCDFLIAVGGGSPIDSMKAIAFMTQATSPIASYMGENIDQERPPMIAIPTTAGTGSEATMFTIITDTANNVKMLLKGACLIPDLAIIDPVFSISTPKSVTTSTGVDALCHAIEAYTSRKAQPFSDIFALSAIKRIFSNLPIVYEEPDNLEARKEMALAATEAGIAFNNSSVTLVHGMSRPIGALFHVPHGLSNAMLLERCMYFVYDAAISRFADIGRYIHVTESNEDLKAAQDFLHSLSVLLQKLSIPTMSAFGIDQKKFYDALDKMAKDAYISGSPGNTIKDVQIEDMIRIYKEVYR